MSTMGSRTRLSVKLQTPAMTTAPAKLPSVRAEVQPHSWPWEIGGDTLPEMASYLVPHMAQHGALVDIQLEELYSFTGEGRE